MFSEVSITDNGPSGSLSLRPGDNKLTISATSVAAGATFIVQTSSDNFATVIEHQDPEDSATPAQLDDADDSSGGTSGREFILSGPGAVRIYAAGFGASTGVVMRVAHSVSR